jgi:hypothetical protein
MNDNGYVTTGLDRPQVFARPHWQEFDASLPDSPFSAIEAGLNSPARTAAPTRRRGLLVMSSPTLLAICQGALDGLPVSRTGWMR